MKYTIDNPKQVSYFTNPEVEQFTGVLKDTYGNIAYFVKGKWHRKDGPAVITAECSYHYYINGVAHRTDGPAVICPSGIKLYYIDGVNLKIRSTKKLKEYLILRMFK